jgi:two-component system chemotaxis response regulator CheY
MIGYGKRVLVVDDDERERQATAFVLQQAGFMVVPACDGLLALSEMQQRRFDAVVTDFFMPHLNGLEFLVQSRLLWPALPVIIFSKGEWDMSEMATAQGAFGWIRKSSDPGILLSMLALAMEQSAERTSQLPMERVGA